MSGDLDGLVIARERIAKEAAERTGFLDLGQLGLTSLPEKLFALTHLRQPYVALAHFPLIALIIRTPTYPVPCTAVKGLD